VSESVKWKLCQGVKGRLGGPGSVQWSTLHWSE
jgi:hypothetical protein